MSKISAKQFNKKSIFIIVAAIVVVVVLGIFVFVSLWQKPSASLSSAIDAGKIEIKSQADKTRYFTFVSQSEAEQMLADAKAKGEFRFLMPQFDVPAAGAVNLTVRNETIPVEGVEARFLIISGLPKGTTVYTNMGKAVEGSFVSQNGKRLFAWIKERNFEDEFDRIVSTLYMPAASNAQQFLSPIESDVFNDMAMASPVLKIETDEYLSETLFPKSSQVAFLMANDEDFSLADLKNVLLKDGKIVMIKK